MVSAKKDLVEEAEKAFRDGKYDKAVKQFQAILAADSEDQRTRLLLADAYVKKKDVSAAVRTLREVAQGYLAGKFQLKAIAVYKNILKLNPGAVEVNADLARLYAAMEMTRDAVHQYQIVAATYESKREYGKAIEARIQIATLQPEEVLGRIKLAELLQREGKDEDAVREYEAVAELARRQKNTKLLIEAYEKLTNRRPERLPEVKELIQMYMEREEWERAGRKLSQLGGIVDKDPDLLVVQIRLLEKQDQWEPAKEKYRLLLGLLVGGGDKKKVAELKKEVHSKFAEDADFLKEIEELVKLS